MYDKSKTSATKFKQNAVSCSDFRWIFYVCFGFYWIFGVGFDAFLVWMLHGCSLTLLMNARGNNHATDAKNIDLV
jgi:hypothetical protein